ncbi:MAG: trehalose-phosphatase [Erythrobacter sp.]|jgi:trehalose 6-phosphate phosphatase|nr:trehalose-phosphatase [Erythrobacter sp.]
MSASPLPPPPALKRLIAAERIALFLDFDGTLVEIAPTPDAIAVSPGLASRLASLSNRLNGACAIISGRAVADLAQHLGESLPVACAGSHGTDIRDVLGERLKPAPAPMPETVVEAMREHAAGEGLVFESKPHGAALHYRGQPAKGPAAYAFAQGLARKHGYAIQGGKSVVELVNGGGDKGDAVRVFMEAAPFKGTLPFFIGDDMTDEKGFAACTELGGAGVIVGERETTLASYALPDVAAVHHWLGL